MAGDNFAVYVFRNDTGLLALVGDTEGTSLPRVDGPWRFVKASSLRPDSDDERHAIDLIKLYGFCCFDDHPHGDDVP